MQFFSSHSSPSPLLRGLLWIALSYVFLAQFLQRLGGYVPNDLAMYLRAGRWWLDGRNVYSEAFRQAGADTLPFVYPPGTLPLFGALSGLSTQIVSVVWFVGGLGVCLGAILYFRRHFTRETPPVMAAGLLFAYFPAYFALSHGNVAVLLLPAAALAHRALGDDDTATSLLSGIVIGVALGAKPYWLLAFGFALGAGHCWRTLAGVGVGLASVATANVWQGHLVGDWLAATGGVDRLSTILPPSPWWLAVTLGLVVAWLAGGVWWVRRHSPSPDAIFVYAMTSVVVWPRVGAYSYLVLLSVLLYLAGRRGWRLAGLLLLPASAPVLWLVTQTGGGLVARVWLYGWAVVCVGVSWKKTTWGDRKGRKGTQR